MTTDTIKLYGHQVPAGDFHNLRTITDILVGLTANGIPLAKSRRQALALATVALAEIRAFSVREYP
jgi:hypothetical protein